MILLDDEAIRRFIVDGFLILEPNLPATLHQEIDRTLRYASEHEFPMGNNILPRIPGLYDVIESPAVQGALTSLLGEDYLLHPHRAIHTSTPAGAIGADVDETTHAPMMGEGSMAGSGWHQDAQSPLARARYHMPRHLILFYFPHDTPREMGPTRLEAGSYLYARPVAPRHVVFPDHLPAGSVIITHFDQVHAGFPNQSDVTRYMLKFVFSRTRHPNLPTWANNAAEWRLPETSAVSHNMTPVWSRIWRWMSGDGSLSGSVDRDIAHLVSHFDSDDQEARLNAIYRLGEGGEQVAETCLEWLHARAGLDRHERHLKRRRRTGEIIPVDDVTREPRWNERAIVMEDAAYVLGLIGGAEAVRSALALIESGDPWLQINSAYILGESHHPDAVQPLTGLLDSPHEQVVRQAADGLGTLGLPIEAAFDAIESLISTTNEAWQEPAVMRGWTAQDQVRLNIAFTLLNACQVAGTDCDKVTALLVKLLDDPNGYVPVVACEALSRIGTPDALNAAVTKLKRQQWDASLIGGVKLY